MDLLTLFLLIIVTCVVFWVFGIAYRHAGAIPEAPPMMSWAAQAIVIIVLILVIAGLWGFGTGHFQGTTLRLH